MTMGITTDPGAICSLPFNMENCLEATAEIQIY